jgi:hypothetical protein
LSFITFGGKAASAQFRAGFEIHSALSVFISFFVPRELSMFKQRVCPRAGFTLGRMLVIVFFVVILVGLAVPAILRAREESAKATTMENLSKCAKAVHLAHDQFKKFAPYFGVYGKPEETTPRTFHNHLLQFVEGPLYANPSAAAVVPAYLSPMDLTQTDGGAGAVNFAVNLRLYYTQGGYGTLAPPDALIYPKMPGSFQGGVSQTLLFATRYMNCGANGGSKWSDPGNNAIGSSNAATFGSSLAMWQHAPTRAECDPTSGTAMSLAKDAMQIAMCDASVRVVKSDITAKRWGELHMPSGRIPDGPDWID